MQSAMRVAVIGGGAGGLCALRHLAARPHLFQPLAFEQTSHIGGTWVYNENVGLDEHGHPIHSSMYKNLRTNLPKEVMAFPDFSFSKSLPSFISHLDVREYLEDYASHFDIKKFIQFETIVERVKPEPTASGLQWNITVRKVDEPEDSSRNLTVDAVMVCNGHYSVPLVPELPGLATFKGKVVHSHNYRHPEDFRGQRVFCLGAGASGQDIVIDMAVHAEQVYLGHRKARIQSPMPSNVHQTLGIQEVRASSVLLTDGEEIDVDTLMLCTGYKYTFPFLTPECQIRVEDERVIPLYKHLIHTAFPSLCIIGICKTICPFPQFDCQIRFFMSTLDGSLVLPTQEQMDAETAADYESRLSRGMPNRYAHTMGPLQWAYNNELTDMAKLESIPKVVQNLYDFVHETRAKNLVGYKLGNFELISETEFKEA